MQALMESTQSLHDKQSRHMSGQGIPLNYLLAIDFIDSAFLCLSLLKGQALEAQRVEKGTSRIGGTGQNAFHWDT